MLSHIILLLVTARQIHISHQCELHTQENYSHCSGLTLPGPFPCGGSVPGITAPVAPAPAFIPAQPVAAVNIGAPNVNWGEVPINPGRAPVCLGPASGLAFSGVSPVPTSARSVLGFTGPYRYPLPTSFISPYRLAELVASGAGLQFPSAGSVPRSFQTCITHALVPVPVQVVEECITNVPVIRKTIRHQTETVTRQVPIQEKTITQQHEQIVRHIPVAQKSIRNVVETSIRHVPVIKSRSRTVVEPYTLHVPITECHTRPVEDSITRTVPYTETRIRPVVVERTRLVPVLARRCRPVVETYVQNVPTKCTCLRHVVERRVRPVMGPCSPCLPFYDTRPERAAEAAPQPDAEEDYCDYQDSTPPHSYDEQSCDENSRDYQSAEDRPRPDSATNSDNEEEVDSPSKCHDTQQRAEPSSSSNDGSATPNCCADQQQ